MARVRRRQRRNAVTKLTKQVATLAVAVPAVRRRRVRRLRRRAGSLVMNPIQRGFFNAALDLFCDERSPFYGVPDGTDARTVCMVHRTNFILTPDAGGNISVALMPFLPATAYVGAGNTTWVGGGVPHQIHCDLPASGAATTWMGIPNNDLAGPTDLALLNLRGVLGTTNPATVFINALTLARKARIAGIGCEVAYEGAPLNATGRIAVGHTPLTLDNNGCSLRTADMGGFASQGAVGVNSIPNTYQSVMMLEDSRNFNVLDGVMVQARFAEAGEDTFEFDEFHTPRWNNYQSGGVQNSNIRVDTLIPFSGPVSSDGVAISGTGSGDVFLIGDNTAPSSPNAGVLGVNLISERIQPVAIIATGMQSSASLRFTIKTAVEYQVAPGSIWQAFAQPGLQRDDRMLRLVSLASRKAPVAAPVSHNASGEYTGRLIGGIDTLLGTGSALARRAGFGDVATGMGLVNGFLRGVGVYNKPGESAPWARWNPLNRTNNYPWSRD